MAVVMLVKSNNKKHQFIDDKKTPKNTLSLEIKTEWQHLINERVMPKNQNWNLRSLWSSDYRMYFKCERKNG